MSAIISNGNTVHLSSLMSIKMENGPCRFLEELPVAFGLEDAWPDQPVAGTWLHCVGRGRGDLQIFSPKGVHPQPPSSD